MTKICKKSLIIVILALCLTACLCMFVACGDESDTTTPSGDRNYTVTVKIDEQTAATGVRVTVRKGGASFDTQTTDSTGKVVFALPDDDYEIAIVESTLPAHYSLPENANLTLSATNRDLTVMLTRSFAYEVKLVDPDGAPIYADGVTVQICTLTGNCLSPVDLEAGGVAYLEYDKGDYKIIINDLDDYTYECDDHGYYTGEQFTAEKTTIEITVYPVTATCEPSDEMTAEKKTAYTAAHRSYGSDLHVNPAYEYNAELDADSAAYYKLTPTVSGRYTFFSTSAVNFYFDGKRFARESAPISGFQTQYGHDKLLEADNTYYFKAYNPNTVKTAVRFVVMTPAASYIELNGLANSASVELTALSADANAIVALTANSAAKFTATVQGAAHTKLTCSEISPKTHSVPTADADYIASATASAKITTRRLNHPLYFAVQIKADEYPASVTVGLTNDGAVVDTERTVTVTETLTQQSTPVGKTLIPVPMTAETSLVYNNTDKFYHLGEENGPVIVVNITKSDPTRIGLDNALAYLDKNAIANVRYESVETVESLTAGDVVTDYREFIRGFKNYSEIYSESSKDIIRNIPDTLAQPNCYANYVDSNGCYPLTKELETFLKALYAENKENFDWNVASGTDGYKWMFACYYYGDSGEVDPVVGKYASASGEFELTVNSGNTFTITRTATVESAPETSDFDQGSWTKTNNVYMFTCIDPPQLGTTLTYANGSFTLSFGETTVTLNRVQN